MAAKFGRRDAAPLAGVLVLVAVPLLVVRTVRTSDDPANTADELSAYIAAAAFSVPLLMGLVLWWRKRRRTAATIEQVTAAANQLAQRMFGYWRQEAENRRISTPAPVRVRWQWGPDELTPSSVELVAAPVAGIGPGPLPGPVPEKQGMLEQGVVTQLHDEVYCRLPHGRLVLVGGRGTGKTGAMILLLLAALQHRSLSGALQDKIPIPVWLTLGGWDPTSQTLHEWAKATIYRDHPYLRALDYGPDVAEELLRSGLVALFMDGFDEMAPAVRHNALARIKQEATGLRIVLSSRSKEYRQAHTRQRLGNTAVITVQPVNTRQASAYLLQDQVGHQRERWTQVADYLTRNPTSVAARTLNNPLALSLARETYQDEDPTPLIDPKKFSTVKALRGHLIDSILITAYPDPDQRTHATRWLAWIAHHMGQERDLAWWKIPAWIPQRQLGLANAFRVGLVTQLILGFLVGPMTGLIIGLLVGLTSGALVETWKGPLSFFPRWSSPNELSSIVMVGTIIGGITVSIIRLAGLPTTIGLVSGLMTGAAMVLTGFIGLTWTVPQSHSETAAPAFMYNVDRRAKRVLGLVSGSAIGLASGVPSGILSGITLGVAAGITSAFLGGLIFWLSIGSVCRIHLTELVLILTGTGRVKFMRLLTRAHRRQVLRQAGAVYQFRHAELQERLAAIHRRQSDGGNKDR